MKAMLLALAMVAGLGMSVMAAEEATPGGSGTPGTPGTPGAVGGPGGGMKAGELSDAISANPDKAFAATMISHARLQREISNLVAEKATNPQIKQYAKDLSQDLEQLSTKVQQAAQKEGIQLQTERMLPRDQAQLEFMKQLPPSTLERNYIFHQAGATQSQLLMCQWAAKNAQKPAIKEAAQEAVTKLQQRHETAQKLAQAEVSAGPGRVAGEE